MDSEGSVSMWRSSGHVKDYENSSIRDPLPGNRVSFINLPEEEKNYAIYPMSKNAVKYIENLNDSN